MKKPRFRLPWCVAAALFALTLLTGRITSAAPERTLYTIAIGHNEAPPDAQDTALVSLRYADDDALRFYSLLRGSSRRAFLLAVLDPDTQRRFPNLATVARPPSAQELEQVVGEVAVAMARDRAAGREPILMLFYSGHGVRDPSGGASLSILGGTLTREWLYDRVLSRLPAHVVHVIVDACHAEAFVRPRDVEATTEALSPAERQRFLETSTLAPFPHVGVVLASAASGQSFEWDVYRGGVFAHELLSALRGAADMNSDGVVEYSEVAAFLAAANRQVADPRARLAIVVSPPAADRRTPLLDRSTLVGQFQLTGRAVGPWARPIYIETETGDRVLDLFLERGAPIALSLPANERLFVVGKDGEAELTGKAGEQLTLAAVTLHGPTTRARGSLVAAMERGLFSTRFGPAFYLGYSSDRDAFVSVPAPPEVDEPKRREPKSKARSRLTLRSALAGALLAGAGVAAVTSGVATGLAVGAAANYHATRLEREAEDARRDYDRYRTIAWGSGAASVALGMAGTAILLWPKRNTSAGTTPRLTGISATASGMTAWGNF